MLLKILFGRTLLQKSVTARKRPRVRNRVMGLNNVRVLVRVGVEVRYG